MLSLYIYFLKKNKYFSIYTFKISLCNPPSAGINEFDYFPPDKVFK